MKEVILILAPHTDDGELGVGGTMSRFLEEGKDVYYVAFSSCRKSLPDGMPEDTLIKELMKAMNTFGIPEDHVTVLDFPVREFSAYRQEILDEMIRINNVLKPSLVFAPYDIYDKLVDGPGIQSSKNTVFYKGNYYYKKPLTEEEITNLNKDISSVMGNVLTTKDGAYPSLDTSVIGGLGDGENDYKKILSSSYGNELKYKNIGEDSYDDGIDYGSGETKLVNLREIRIKL